MNLYQIDERLLYLIEEGFDNETGEILEGFDLKKALDEVSLELDKKIENIGAFYKNLLSDADQLKKEEDNLKKRRKILENKAERLKGYLDNYFRNTVDIEKFKKISTPKCVINYRKSTTLNIKDLNKIPQDYIKPHQLSETDVDKPKIKKYLQTSGKSVDYAELVENRNLSIK